MKIYTLKIERNYLMITIYAEKPDVGRKIAAALDCVTLSRKRKIAFDLSQKLFYHFN